MRERLLSRRGIRQHELEMTEIVTEFPNFDDHFVSSFDPAPVTGKDHIGSEVSKILKVATLMVGN